VILFDREPRSLERLVGRDPASDAEEQPGHQLFLRGPSRVS
jgi:hypothetical protein